MLHEFIGMNREEIIRRCRAKVAVRSMPPPTATEIDHGVPVFLDQLTDALRLGLTSTPDIGRSAVQHGHDRLLQGFTVSQVVNDYGDICQAVTDLAVDVNATVSADEFRTLNRCLDEAIAGAVTEYGREQNQTTLAGEAARGSERLGYLAHELRNLTNTAMFAFELLKTGEVGIAGSTGRVLHRSLLALRNLSGRSLDEVRFAHGTQNREEFGVCGFIEELAETASLQAKALGITLTVAAVGTDITIDGDRHILAEVVGNLLQNAFKFTRPGTTVTLRAGASFERVLIEVQDECGGLPSANLEALFRPFEQRAADRSGVGFGLAFSRWGVEANGGRIYARNLPDAGCVFTVDLPRVPLRAVSM